MNQDLRDRLLLSIEGNRLSLLCGAGLSMSPPTDLPSAAALAELCAEGYKQVTGTVLPKEVWKDLDLVAEHFLRLSRFRDLIAFIPWGGFNRNPNEGHFAVADFLCCGGFEAVVTTNYDTHIEAGLLKLGEQDPQVCLDGVEANQAPDRHKPLLKLHGCCSRDRMNTLWAHIQLSTNPTIQKRIDSGAEWFKGHLGGNDLIVLGFWSDWAYLNDVLLGSLAGSEPRTVVVVDPADEATLKAKAPDLWGWVTGPDVEFFHVSEHGHLFLNELRVAFSRQFVHRALEAGRDTTVACFGGPDPSVVNVPESMTAADLYSIRKDLSGCSSKRAVRCKRPDESVNLVAAFIHALLRKGGQLIETSIHLQGLMVRVINCPNQLLSVVRADFAEDLGTSRDCDTIICVGAVDDGAPGNLVRGGKERTIVREGWSGEWLTYEGARVRLGI